MAFFNNVFLACVRNCALSFNASHLICNICNKMHRSKISLYQYIAITLICLVIDKLISN